MYTHFRYENTKGIPGSENMRIAGLIGYGVSRSTQIQFMFSPSNVGG